MFSYFIAFSAGAMVGTLITGVFVAFVNYRDGRSDW
jgi:cytochrome bd-type quinol oxidase subunit 2